MNPRDFLRLEVEVKSGGLVNLVKNPNGDLGGWGWITPTAGSAMAGSTATGLTYTTAPSVAQSFTTEPLPCAAGQYAAARWENTGGSPTAIAYYRARFEWLDASKALISSGLQTGYTAGGVTSKNTILPVVAPAGTAYLRLRFDLYNSNTGTAPPSTPRDLRLKNVTVATAAASATLGGPRRNLIINPRFGTATTGWTVTYGTLTRMAARQAKVERTGVGVSAVIVTSANSGAGGQVVAGNSYTGAVARLVNQGTGCALRLVWVNGAGAIIGYSAQTASDASMGGLQYVTGVAPTGATQARLEVTFNGMAPGSPYNYVQEAWLGSTTDAGIGIGQVGAAPWSGATADTADFDYAWEGTPDASYSTATPLGVGLDYIPPVAYVDVLDQALEVKVPRYPLDVGSLSATIRDTTLDPAASSAVRPGRKCRLMALAGGSWSPIYNGRLDNALVAYDLKRPLEKDTTITLSALDANSDLANVNRPNGVGTIAELPYVLEGAGVPWSVDGSGNQVPTAVVAAVNENASVLDQVALTRDSALGYAWTDVRGVLVAKSDRAAAYYAGEPFLLTDADYTGLDVAFDTQSIINQVLVVLVATDASGNTTETTYGPYSDAASVNEWGPRQATFTVQGVTVPATYAAAILAANSQPQVRISSLTIPIRDAADVVAGKALLDLYAKVRVTNTRKGLDQTLRVTSLEHSITAKRWTLTLGFDLVGQVASPSAPPSTSQNPAGDGKWHNLTLAGAWAQVTTRVPQYLVLNGVCYLRGRVAGGAVGSTIATLPVGARPVDQSLWFVADGNVTTNAASAGTAHTHTVTSVGSEVSVGTTGAIVHGGNRNDFQDLAGIAFPVV